MKLNFMWCREQDFEPRRRGSTSNWTITHKAHLDHDITRAIAHYKGVVYLKKKTGWKFHQWTPLSKDSRKWTRPFYWKTHPSKIYEYLFSFFIIGSIARPYTWKSHPIVNCRILGHGKECIFGKLIRTWTSFPLNYRIIRFSKNWIGIWIVIK